MNRADIQAKVQEILLEATQSSRDSLPAIGDSSHLLSDLGLTSLNLAEVAIGIEDRLGLAEFPVADWLKLEAQRTDSTALTVGSLVDACVALAAKSGRACSEQAVVQQVPDAPATASAAVVASQTAAGHKAVLWIAAALVVCAAVAAAVLGAP